MIVFDLKCPHGHIFEAWFRSSQTYEDQQASGEIACPLCGSIDISKAVMAPNISASKDSDRSVDRALEQGQDYSEQAPAASCAALPAPEAYKELLEGVRRTIRENCEDVGKNFAEEAKKIHYGEAEKRGIYGEATPEESESLRDEGIDFMQLPISIRTDS